MTEEKARRKKLDEVTVVHIREYLEEGVGVTTNNLLRAALRRDKNKMDEEFKSLKRQVEELSKLDELASLPILKKVLEGECER